MKVTIEQQQMHRGFFSKTTFYYVVLDLEFTDDEKKNIEANKLGDTILYIVNGPDGEVLHPKLQTQATVGKFVSGKAPGCRSQCFDNLNDALLFEEDLKKNILPTLKRLIDQVGGSGGPKSFEL
jgi:hypothetical protein